MNIVSEQAFDEAVKEGKTVVEVYANWCPDCKRIEPMLESWATAYDSRFTLLRLNRDDIPEVAQRYEVMGIPSFLVFEDGELTTRLLSRDAKTVRQVEDFLEKC